MAQYLLHPKHPLRTIVYIVLALGFLVGGYFTFKATQTSTEGRSKAALEGKIYKRWEFKGPTTEGWEQTGLQSLVAAKDRLQALLSVNSSESSIAKNSINAKLDRGNKVLSFRMAVRDLIQIVPSTGEDPMSEVSLESASEDGGLVDCSVSSNGVTSCLEVDEGNTEQGQESGGVGTGVVRPETSTGSEGSTTEGTYPCVPKPECKPGQLCTEPLLYPRGGWCATPTPPPSCTPCTDPRGFCPLEEYGAEPPGGWCPPPPPCQPRPSCLDAKPACKKLTPPGGWCPANGEFEFTITYGYEEPPIGGNKGGGPSGGRRVEKTATVRGKADGKFYTYNISFPVIQAVKLLDLRITFTSGVDSGDRADFDWIRVASGAINIKKRAIRMKYTTPIPRITAKFTKTCGKKCSDDSECEDGLRCVERKKCPDGGDICVTKDSVCAVSSAKNAKGYICK